MDLILTQVVHNGAVSCCLHQLVQNFITPAPIGAAHERARTEGGKTVQLTSHLVARQFEVISIVVDSFLGVRYTRTKNRKKLAGPSVKFRAKHTFLQWHK
jgi:hypothetical protein